MYAKGDVSTLTCRLLSSAFRRWLNQWQNLIIYDSTREKWYYVQCEAIFLQVSYSRQIWLSLSPESPTTRTFALSIAPMAAIIIRDCTLCCCTLSKHTNCTDFTDVLSRKLEKQFERINIYTNLNKSKPCKYIDGLINNTLWHTLWMTCAQAVMITIIIDQKECWPLPNTKSRTTQITKMYVLVNWKAWVTYMNPYDSPFEFNSSF